MIGMQGSRFEPGSPLSDRFEHCIPHIIDAVRRELYRLNVWCDPKASAAARRHVGLGPSRDGIALY